MKNNNKRLERGRGRRGQLGQMPIFDLREREREGELLPIFFVRHWPS